MINPYFLNKCGGALLFAVLIVFGLNELSHGMFAAHGPKQPAYAVEMTAIGDQHGNETVNDAEMPSLAEMLAAADPAKGASVAKKCTACHEIAPNAANKIGPGLWNLVDRQIASVADFSYSNILKQKGEAGQLWNYQDLNAFIENPKGYAPGTKMTFRGISKTSQRVNLIAWLREQADQPQPLPSP